METELTFEQLYSDLVAAHTETLPERYFTLGQFRNDTGLSYWLARKKLAAYVESGKIETRTATVNGHNVRIWWFI